MILKQSFLLEYLQTRLIQEMNSAEIYHHIDKTCFDKCMELNRIIQQEEIEAKNWENKWKDLKADQNNKLNPRLLYHIAH